MTDSGGKRGPFRAEHVGSFLRPERLLNAVRARKREEIDEEQLLRVQDESVSEIVAFQEGLGLKSVTDGEFRRRSWSAGFIDAVSGFGLREEGVLSFKDEGGDWGVSMSPYAKEKLRRTRPIVADDFRYLKKVTKTAVPKVTVASPTVMHFFLGPRAVDENVYPDMEEFYADLAAVYQAEIAELAEEGCTYFQLDDTALPCNCDEGARAGVSERGEDPDQLTTRYVRLINDALSGRPDNMTVGVHMCRGNLKGAWMAEGGYEPIADEVFNNLDVDGFFLEFDDERSGDFQPLRHMPKGKTAVLGLISTKTPELESADTLKRRIDDASKYLPLEQLALSPQCGFSSGGGSGQTVTQDDTKRKIELMVSVVEDVWGSR